MKPESLKIIRRTVEDILDEKINKNFYKTFGQRDFLCFFKILLIKRYYGLDNNLLFDLLKDRTSFQHFIGVKEPKNIPSLGKFKSFEATIDSNKLYDLYEKLDFALLKKGLKVNRVTTKEPELIKYFNLETKMVKGSPLKNINSIPEYISCLNLAELSFPVYLRAGTSDLDVYSEIFVQDIYKFKLNFEPEFIVDCGGNIGLASVYFKNRYLKSQIVSIEPENSNFNLMDRNLSFYFPSVRCLKGAVWNKATSLGLSNGPDGKKWGYVVSETLKCTIQTTKSYTINEIMRQYNKEYIDILKIDIEGAEKELFENNYSTWMSKTKVLLIELHDRIKEGCSKSFFAAISNFNYSVSMKGNILICKNSSLK